LGEVEIDLAVVQLNDLAFQNARNLIMQLDLRTLVLLQPPNPQLTNEKDYSTQSTKRQYDCSLSCSEKIEKEPKKKAEDEISFHCSRFRSGWELNSA
jgi:hypothetical protein